MFFPAATVGPIMLPLMIYHHVQLVVCAVIASRMGRKTDEMPQPRMLGKAGGSSSG